MDANETYVPQGVIPAVLMPFHEDYSIDEPSARKHLSDVAAVRGLSAITVNGHAAEVHALSLDEQQRVLEFSLDEVGGRIPLIASVLADGSLQAARIARMAQRAGAAALLIIPPHCMSMGWHLRPEMAKAHFAAIAAATDLPLILFQYPARTGLHYPFDTLLQLCEQFPTIRAIKDWCHDPPLPRPVTVLTTHTAWLMASLVMGAGGLLSGAGSVIADLRRRNDDSPRQLTSPPPARWAQPDFDDTGWGRYGVDLASDSNAIVILRVSKPADGVMQATVVGACASDINVDGRQCAAFFHKQGTPGLFFSRGFSSFGIARKLAFDTVTLKAADALGQGQTAGLVHDMNGDHQRTEGRPAEASVEAVGWHAGIS